MKRIVAVLVFLTAEISACGWIQNLTIDLEPSEIGEGWKRTKRSDGKDSVRHYTREDSGIWVMVTIRFQGQPKRALKKFAERPEIAPNLKKVSDSPLSYEQRYLTHKKRYIVVGSYWLEVEQIHEEDVRDEVIEAYFKKLTAMLEEEKGKKKN